MPTPSSFELSRRMASAVPDEEHVALVKKAFLSVRDDTIAEQENEVIDVAGALVASKSLIKDSGLEMSASHLACAGSFLVAATTPEERASMTPEMASRQIVSIATVDKAVEGVDIRTAVERGGFEPGKQDEVATAIYNVSGLNENAIAQLSGLSSFSPPEQQDMDFASKVLSSDLHDLRSDKLALNAALAVRALDIDPEGPDVGRLSSALERVSSDFRHSGDMAVEPDVSPLTIRLASDIASQARATRLLDDDPEIVLDGETVIREVASNNSLLRSEIEAEARGDFHQIPRGGAMDIRSDLASGANLPEGMLAKLWSNAKDSVEFDISQQKSTELAAKPRLGMDPAQGVQM